MCSPFGIKVIGEVNVPLLIAVPVITGIAYIIIYIHYKYHVSSYIIHIHYNIYNAYKNIFRLNCLLGLTKKILLSSIFAFKTKSKGQASNGGAAGF